MTNDFTLAQSRLNQVIGRRVRLSGTAAGPAADTAAAARPAAAAAALVATGTRTAFVTIVVVIGTTSCLELLGVRAPYHYFLFINHFFNKPSQSCYLIQTG
jgi:hypothetical protein